MNTKAQTISQIFIFVLAGLVFILILTYGYKGIKSFTSKSEAVALIDMEKSLQTAVESIRLDFGSVKKVTVRVPSKYKQLCFVTDSDQATLQALAQEHPLLAEAAKGGTQNVFTIPLAKNAMNVDGIATQNGFHCVDVTTGGVDLRFESRGNDVLVSNW